VTKRATSVANLAGSLCRRTDGQKPFCFRVALAAAVEVSISTKNHWSLSPPGEWQLQFEADIVEVFKEIAAVLERRGLTISPQIPWNILGDRQMKRWEEVRAIIEKTQSLEANHVSFEFPRAYHRFPSLSKNPQKTSPVILHL
jgi:sugar phosphate isomerase/epimerase